uniref:(northern house mosquito) hypothetical protein n=1 Tax=Culex pipiens TaxID=7175 RepID=A0A8D8MSK3_CULPI
MLLSSSLFDTTVSMSCSRICGGGVGFLAASSSGSWLFSVAAICASAGSSSCSLHCSCCRIVSRSSLPWQDMCLVPCSPQSRDSWTAPLSDMYCTVSDGIDVMVQSVAQVGTGSSHRKAAVSGPPQRSACQRKSRTGSTTAQSGVSIAGSDSAQYPLAGSNVLALLKRELYRSK